MFHYFTTGGRYSEIGFSQYLSGLDIANMHDFWARVNFISIATI